MVTPLLERWLSHELEGVHSTKVRWLSLGVAALLSLSRPGRAVFLTLSAAAAFPSRHPLANCTEMVCSWQCDVQQGPVPVPPRKRREARAGFRCQEAASGVPEVTHLGAAAAIWPR